MKNVLKRILSSKRGISLIQVMAIGAAVAALIVVLGQNIQTMRKASSDKGKSNKYRSLASGSLVYAQYLLEKRKCVNLGTGLTNSDCDGLWDSGNLERLLLLPKTVNDINERFPAYKTKPTSRVGNIKLVIPRDSVNTDHPLHPLMYAKGLKNVKKIIVNYMSEYNPTFGDANKVSIEVVVRAEVNGVMGKTVKTVMKARRKIIVFPRTINYFSLSLNGDLIIGKKNAVPNPNRPVRKINQFDFDGKGKGMTFHSPIFINGSIYLPRKVDGEVKGARFHAPVYVGELIKTSDNQPFVPEKAGLNEALSQYSTYKGLLAGIVRTETEPSLANIFSKDYSGTKPRLDEMNACIGYAQRRFDSAATTNSRILVKKGTSSNEVILGLSKLNEFITARRLSYRTSGSHYFGFKSGGSLPKIGLRLEWEDYRNGDDKTVKTQMGPGDVLSLKDDTIKQLYQFYEYTGYDPVKHECVKESLSGKIKNENYPDLNIKVKDYLVKGVRALNRISIDVDIDHKESENITVHSSGSLPNVYCGLRGRWRERPEMSIRAYNFRENSYYPRAVKDKDDGGPNYDSHDPGREIRFSIYDKGAKLGLDTSRFDNIWRFIKPSHHRRARLHSVAPLSQLERDSLSDDKIPMDFYQVCMGQEPTGESVSSVPSGINTDFTKSAFVSWNYNPISKDFQYKPGKSGGIFWSQIFNKNSNRMFLNELILTDANDVLFHVYSVVDRCIVRNTAKTFNGFMVCRHMIIEDRDAPLQMLGGFIVDKLTIHPRAVKAGIDWKNVHREDTQEIFRKKGILNEDESCKINSQKPKWFKLTGDDQDNCNTAALSIVADPFIWTSFNPACGLENVGDVVTKCKPFSRARNFVSIILQESYEI